jgi:RHS repeat-associated protein
LDFRSSSADGSGTDTVTSYAYNDANELCWHAGGSHTSDCSSPPSNAADYDDDPAGNETSEQNGRQSTYDVRNRLTGVSGTSLAYLSPTNDELIQYGSTALRTNLLGVSAYGGENYVRSSDGALLAQFDATSTQYVLRDRIGSTVGLIQGSSIARDYTYNPDGAADTSGSGAGTAIRFAGGIQLDGLYHFGARYYDPNLGRWTQPDPLTHTSDLTQNNRYLYAAADPVNQTDATGLATPCEKIGAGFHAIGILFRFASIFGAAAGPEVSGPLFFIRAAMRVWGSAWTSPPK